MRFLLIVLLLPCLLFGGQSLNISGLTGDTLNTIPSPNLGDAAQSWCVEWHWHDMQMPDSNVIAWMRFNNLGFYLNVYTPATSPTGLIQVIAVGSKDGGFSAVGLNWGIRETGLFRICRDAEASEWRFEAWDLDGSNYQIDRRIMSSLTTTSGTNTDLKPLPASLGFLRIRDHAVPPNSKPPTTADAGNVAEWKFDGNLNDGASPGLGAITLTGTAYVDTPGQDFVSIIAQTQDTPFWAPFRPMRAGHPNTLDSTRSFSMADASDEVSCIWVQIDGPSRVRWLGEDGPNTCEPQLTGLVFGPYDFRLIGRDVDGNEGEIVASFGAVAYDDEGVVIYPDDRLYDLLGPTTVLGQNPWEWPDAMQVEMALENMSYYSGGSFTGTWENEMNPPNRTFNGVPREGVVWWNSSTNKLFGSGTNFIRVFRGGHGPGPTMVTGVGRRILPEFARAGNMQYMYRVLQPTYIHSDTEMDLNAADVSLAEENAVPWNTRGLLNVFEGATGTVYFDYEVDQRKVYGVGTNFLSEFCGGEVGPATSTLKRMVFIGPQSFRRRVTSCESDTELTLWEDIQQTTTAGLVPNTVWASPGYGWLLEDTTIDRGEWNTASGPTSFVNFYDVAAAMYSLYYRTGWKRALEAARFVSSRHWKYWVPTPRNNAFRGTLISFLVDSDYLAPGQKDAGDEEVFWHMLNRHRQDAKFSVGCLNEINDVRESGYCFEGLGFLAKYHPDAAIRDAVKQELVDAYDAQVEAWLHPTGAVLMQSNFQDGAANLWWNFTNGSTTVTKAGGSEEADPDYCGEVATFYDTGTVEVSGEDMRTITVTGGDWTGQSGKTIMLHGLLDGQPYSQRNVLNDATASGGTLSYTWPGDGHPTKYRLTQGGSSSRRSLFTFRVNSDGSSAGPRVMDPDHWHWCTVDSPTQLTLERPWEGPSEVRRIRFNATGTRASTLMYGIFAMGMLEVAEALADYDAEAAAKYRFAADEQMRFYEETQTEFSGAATFPYFPYHSQVCEPRYVFPNACANTSSNWTVNVMRAFSIETFRYISKRYLHTQDEADRARGEEWSRRLFAREGFAAPVAGDGNWSATINPGDWRNNVVQTTKNFGQAFGQGGSQVWSAARLGGVSPPVTQPTGMRLDWPAGTTRAVVSVTLPNGSTSEVECLTSRCDLSSIDRRGDSLAHVAWYAGETRTRRTTTPIQIR